ncbi:hypothetical protein K431DRAFT_142310 [Polychaeton citri CBS 116435]|uniref:Fucose-specific lectin n=1 Tax=Polychaeton citri CBS 116435 TaxID=1314669 RepID=A0A9P4Q012_9PEZI|nr:hypothetical protein K431DRAFT_142310 [Polychaeton citri CBS 116435]
MTETTTGRDSNSGSGQGDQGDPYYTVGGALNPSYYTTEGAFNGSGIALASQSFSESLEGGTQGSLVMYFQHWSGQIRWQQLDSQGNWLGGDVSEVVAVDAKNATPLSAVSYSIGGRSQWHIFYIDRNNTLRQRSNSNTTNVWVDGPIGDLNLKVLDADQLGMQACWYGSDYGDTDYVHTPLPDAGPDSEFQNEVGMRMWFAKDNTTFSQYGWRAGDAQWTFDHDWTNLNGHAGVGCYSWGPGNVTYTMFVDLENTVRFYWKDTNTNLTNTTTHPINKWTEAPLNIPGVWPSTSLGYTNAFYAQMEDRSIHGFNITWNAENSTFIGADNFTVDGVPPIGGTHMSVTAIPNASGGNTLMVFCQQNGSDITEHARDLVAGQWSQVNIQIPQE